MTTDTAAPAAAPVKRCFSGSGRYANRKWAPGGDASYLSRLRKAHLADEQVPDPWYIQDHGGIESELPEGTDAWPTMDAIDVARRLDQERGGGVDSHWVHTLEQAAEKAKAKKEAKAARDAQTQASKAEKDAERARQASRPRKGTKVRCNVGEHSGEEATVIRTISPTQLLIQYNEGGQEELVTDEDIEVLEQPAASEETASEDAPEGEFQEA